MANEIYNSSDWGNGVCDNAIDWGVVYKDFAGCTPSFTNTYSLAFDGVDDYVDTGITTTGTNDVSISCWIKTNETFAYTESRCAFGGIDLTFGANYTLGRLGSEFGSPDDMKVRVFNTFGTTKLNDNSWHNIIYTYDYTSKEVKVYVDGNTTPEISATVSLFRSKKIAIGWNGTTSSYHFEGNVDEASYFNSVLTPANVSSIYNSGTPNDISSISGLTAWYRNGDNGSYKSPQWLIPNNSNVANSRFSNYSFDYDGIDDHILTSSSFVATGVFTLSLWMKPTILNSNQNILGNGTSSNNWVNPNGTTGIRVKPAGTLLNFSETGGNNLTVGSWNHILIYRDSSDNIGIFVNGATFGATANNSNTLTLSTIGRGTNKYFSGNLDEVAFWNADKSSDVATIYSSGTPNDLSSLSPVGYWRSENSTFSTNWTVTDNGSGSSDGTSANMTIEDRVGDASGSTLNGISFNMTESDREEDTPS